MARGRERGVFGVVVAGGVAPLAALGAPPDAALTPFAGTYRLLDFTLASLLNSGARPIHVMTPSRGPALAAHLHRAPGLADATRRPIALPAAGVRARGVRLRDALRRCTTLTDADSGDLVAVISADHLLHADLRRLGAIHRALGADATLIGLPVPLDAAETRVVLDLDPTWQVRGVSRPPFPPMPGSGAFCLTWAGDLLISTRALRATAATLMRDAATDEPTLLEVLTRSLRVAACDVLETTLPGRADPTSTYWHEPTTLEAWYEAQMVLCTPRPALDLHNPAWPVLPIATGLGPARIVTDDEGRGGQTHNAIVGEGALVYGGLVKSTIIGPGAIVESCAEVEDSILLDGARVGRGARVRRAIVAAGAAVPAAEEIGFGDPPPPGALACRSGLTLVGTPAPTARAVGR